MATPTVTEARFSGSGATTAERSDARADIGQMATYWLSMVAIYLIQGALWYYGAYEKIVQGDLKAPPPIKEAFDGSFIASFPGTGFAWAVISIAEAFIVIGLLASLIRMEFLPSKSKPILMASLAFSVVVLGALLFGQSMIAAHDSVFQLFTYGAGTLVMMAAVLWLSPGSKSR